MRSVLDRFLAYIAIETTAIHDSDTYPSTAMQLDFAKFMVEEMKAIGIEDAEMDQYGYVMGTIPATVEGAPTIGYIAHMDTVSDISGANIKPSVITYQGGDIVLNKELGIVMQESVFPQLKDYVGQRLVVTDGTTLLGADDKAGIAEILTAAEILIKDPSIPHGPIRIGFTPDEEVGTGTKYFDVKKFHADFGYTIDGGALGGLEYENFNAATAKVVINGTNIHPGASKNKMKNSLLMAMEFQAMLPVAEQPAYTEGYEGFSHLNVMEGNVERSSMTYIIRDHDSGKFEVKKARFQKIAAYLNEKYGDGTVELTLIDSYRNMREVVEPHMHLIDNAKAAFSELGITPVISPIRGGTDGARLSYMGLPCPNLSTGGQNAHGKYEFVSVESMERMVEVLIKLATKYASFKNE